MSGTITDHAIEEIKRRTSLVGLIGEYVTLKKAGHSWKGLCPFHGEKTPSFHVDDTKGRYHCFGCQASGDAISFLREKDGLSFSEAVRLLAERAGVELPERDDGGPRRPAKDTRELKDRYYALNREALHWYRSRLGGPALGYLAEKRRLTPAVIDAFQLGYAPDEWEGFTRSLGADPQRLRDAESLGLVAPRGSERGGCYDRFRHRVMFPVFGLGGQIIGFSGRTLGSDPETPKYINSSESEVFKKGHNLFGLHQAKKAIKTKLRAIVVEGNVDVITLHQHGFDETVAPMGTALTEEQCLMIKRFTSDVVLVYDGDGAGRAAAFKAVPLMLKAGVSGRVVSLPTGEDPDTYAQKYGPEGLERLIADAPPLFDHVLDHAMEAHDGTIPSKSAVVDVLKPVFALVTSPIEQNLYRRKIAERLGLAEIELRRWLRGGTPGPEAVATTTTDVPRPPGPERDVLRLLLAHPEWMVHWQAQGGVELLTHDGVRTILESAWALCMERGRLDLNELQGRLRAQGAEPLSALVGALMVEDDPYGDKAEQAFLENVSDLARKADKRQRAAARGVGLREGRTR